AAADTELFQRVAAHREVYFRWTWMDYSTLKPGALRLTPPDHRLAAWRIDFQKMRGAMFFGTVPEFDEILRVVGEFERGFNADALPTTEAAKHSISSDEGNAS